MIGANGGEQLSREQELELSQRFRTHGDLAARDLLVRSQLATVATIARTYRRYSSTVDELIAEGNFGLVHAIAKFDRSAARASSPTPRTGSGLTSWPTSPARKRWSAPGFIPSFWASCAVNATRSRTCSAKARQRMHHRRTPERVAREAAFTERAPGAARLATARGQRDSAGDRFGSLVAPSLTGEETLLSSETRARVQKAVSLAMKGLDARERYIVQNRLMAHREDELSLAEIGRNLGVSRERARPAGGPRQAQDQERPGP